MAGVNVGTTFSGDTDQGPLINKQQYEKILGYIKSGQDEGAKLHLGGKSVEKQSGHFIEPTIFTNVSPEMKVCNKQSHSYLGFRQVTLANSFYDRS